jgi:hypothetical protein
MARTSSVSSDSAARQDNGDNLQPDSQGEKRDDCSGGQAMERPCEYANKLGESTAPEQDGEPFPRLDHPSSR